MSEIRFFLLGAAAALTLLAACGGGEESPPAARAEAACAINAPSDPRGVWIPAGTLRMGSNLEPEERPIRDVEVAGFWIDVTEVTNAQFATFVEATGYVTVAERALDPRENPGVPAAMLAPGSAVFFSPTRIANLSEIGQWWRFTPGANWRHPNGPDSTIEGRGAFPVVHVVEEDARAYAQWAGRALPSEAQWEWAARGGVVGAAYIWGDEPYPEGKQRANTWQGFFPLRDEGADGYEGLAPVGCFEPNAYGLYDMAGNVWEWTTNDYQAGDRAYGAIKGGSYLCAPNFCGRFRPAARQPGDRQLGSSHIGFRTVLVDAGPS
ncbi:MAG TPA: formylglycine-generating enzyme family protein [Terricaulis sp.]|nr:formylglycine-generating enzyme family protein [Terricaulis sp.]